jgi:RNA polymerase sigma-B factor
MAQPMTRPSAKSNPISSTDERALLSRYHLEGDEQARTQLVESMMPLVRQIAQSYSGRGEQVDDLIQVGSIGLLNAIERFDLDREVRLSTFASPTISGEIKRHFRDRTWALRTPRDLQELYASLRRQQQQFENENGRTPTVPELCELTGRDEESVLDAMAAGRNFRTKSLDAPVEGEDRSVADRVGTEELGYARADARALISACAERLSERERTVVALRYVRGLTQREIADTIGVSQMHVSRMLRRSLETMRNAVT